MQMCWNKCLNAVLSKKFPAGTDICRESEEANSVIWVLSGRLKTAVHLGEKEETVIDIISRGGKLGLAEVAEGGAYSVSAQSIEDAAISV